MLLAILLAALAVDPATYVGNVYGNVLDERGVPVAGAQIELREGTTTIASARTNDSGSFLINSIPAPFDGQIYTIAAGHEGHTSAAIDNVKVLPGAAMALEATFKLSSGVSTATHRYRHERSYTPESRIENYTRTVFATREGLVGGTTANGHVIVENDHFVALPSRRALAKNFSNDHEVRVSYRGRTVVVPVWDIGPWNIHDDYWNPAEIRETFKDLPRGKPEAEAAFREGYNGGLDERGRLVRTPAGIDLADGVFRLDLVLPDNDWVEVEYLWLDSTGPDSSQLRASPNPAAPAILLNLDAMASDFNSGNSAISGAEFFIDTPGEPGTGIPAPAADGIFDSAIENVHGIYETSTWLPGTTHEIFFRARDIYGNWGQLTSTTVSVVVRPRRRAVHR